MCSAPSPSNLTNVMQKAEAIRTQAQAATAAEATKAAQQAVEKVEAANKAMADGQQARAVAESHFTSAQAAYDVANNALNMAPLNPLGSPLDEWKECRASIGRFDTLLVDLRKTGFGFITALVAAIALLLTRPIDPNVKTLAIANLPYAVPVLCAMILLLILTLYAIDLIHGVWLAQSVERARTLEIALAFELTGRISERVNPRLAGWVRRGVYLALVLLVGVIFAGATNPQTNDIWLVGAAALVVIIIGSLMDARLTKA